MKNITSKLLLPIIAVLSCNACSSLHNATNRQHSDNVAVQRDFRTDSIIIERAHLVYLRGDTIIMRDTLFRDRVRTISHSDTIFQKQEVYIQKPVRYVPRFYKGCAWAVGILCLLIAGYIFFRIKRR